VAQINEGTASNKKDDQFMQDNDEYDQDEEGVFAASIASPMKEYANNSEVSEDKRVTESEAKEEANDEVVN